MSDIRGQEISMKKLPLVDFPRPLRCTSKGRCTHKQSSHRYEWYLIKVEIHIGHRIETQTQSEEQHHRLHGDVLQQIGNVLDSPSRHIVMAFKQLLP